MRVSSRNAAGAAVVLVALIAWGEDVTTLPSPRSPSHATAAAVRTPAFRQVVAGWNHRCGVATDGRAWCWALNQEGTLENGLRAGT
jgi:hypothetical protein